MSYHYHHHHSHPRNRDEDNQRFSRGSRYAGEEERYRTASHRKRRSSGDSHQFARKSSRYEPSPCGRETSGASDFERMARSMLAGTLVEPGDVSGAGSSSYSTSPPSNPDIYPVFGKPIPRPAPVMFGEMYRSENGIFETNLLAPPPPAWSEEPPVIDLCEDQDICQPSCQTSVRLNHPVNHPVVSELQRTEEEMVARAEACLSESDQSPSRVLQLDRFVSREQLSSLYQFAIILPCSHQVCRGRGRGRNCYHLPHLKDQTSTGQTVLEFTSEAKAAIFQRVLSSQGFQSEFVASSRSCQEINLTSLLVREEFRVGIPRSRTTRKETYCVCPVILHCLSSASVEDGLVSAPIKISLYTGGPDLYHSYNTYLTCYCRI